MDSQEEHQYVPVLYQGTQMAFDLAEVTMKVCCCVASLGTFKRIVDTQDIPAMFLGLPTLLITLFIIQKFTKLKEDPTTLGMVSGALLGVITGFLSGIDKLVQEEAPDPFAPAQSKTPIVYNLEIFHIPVVFGSVMYSFCLVFDRLPRGNKLRWAGMSSLCGSIILTMYRSTMMSTSRYQTNSVNQIGVFLMMMLVFFLLGLLPGARQGQKAWIICTVCWMVQLIWQSSFFDGLLWNWRENQFPVPGFVTAMIIVFLADCLISLRTPKLLAVYCERIQTRTIGKEPMEPVLNAFLWHAVTFIVQKISLYMIEQKKHGGPFVPTYTFEATITCVLSLLYLYVVSSSLRATPVIRTIIILMALFYYTIQGLTSMGLPNGLFIDIIFGLTIVYTIQVHHIDEICQTQ